MTVETLTYMVNCLGPSYTVGFIINMVTFKTQYSITESQTGTLSGECISTTVSQQPLPSISRGTGGQGMEKR